MEPLIIPLVMVVLLLAIGRLTAKDMHGDARRRRRRMVSLLVERGLAIDASDRVQTRLSGSLEGAAAKASIDAGTVYLALEVALPAALTIADDHGAADAHRLVELGDPDFARGFRVSAADPVDARSRLPSEVRDALRHLGFKARQILVRASTLEVWAPPSLPVADLGGLVDRARAVARAVKIASDGDRDERLARIAFEDAAPGVRRGALETLLATLDGREAERLVQRARASLDPVLLFAVAERLGDTREAADILGELLDRSSLPEAVRAEALRGLMRLERAPDLRTLAHLARTAREDLSDMAVAAIERRADDAALRALVGLLDASEERVGVAAAEALGRCGPLSAVEALVAKRVEGGARDSALKRAARQSIAAIQARHRGGAGQLSVVAEEGARGGLAVVAGDGALSEIDEP